VEDQSLFLCLPWPNFEVSTMAREPFNNLMRASGEALN
jgi:hypothetical protein